MSTRHMIRSPFPLGDDFVAVLNLPHDLTPAEAERIADAVKALAIPPPTPREE